METDKAKPRRLAAKFFERFTQGRGIDIGHGGYPLLPSGIDLWDKEQGDATLMAGVPDAFYNYVYSSHCLEHLDEPRVGLRNWWRILKPGGYLILLVPHRDLYEKRTSLPSRFNGDHKTFWLPERGEPPNTIGLLPLLTETLRPFDFVYMLRCDEGHTITDPNLHSDGEYSIECVIRKKP